MKARDAEIALGILEHAASLSIRLIRSWSGPRLDLADVTQRAEAVARRIQEDLADLDAEEQAEIDAAVPRRPDGGVD